MRAWLARLRGDLWFYLALAALLTVLMVGFGGLREMERIAVRFVINLIISLSIGLTLSAISCFLLPRLPVASRPGQWAARVLTMALGVVLGVELALGLTALLFPHHARAFPRGGVLLVSGPVTVLILALQGAFRGAQERAARLQASEAEARERLLAARLEALQARTNPHFLFNGLNAVAALIGEDPPRAEAAVLRLAALLRYALEGARRERVPLSEELAAVESYLAFERLRFGERLVSAVEVEPEAAELLVPPLILQPLVENAVNHGVGARSGGGQVRVSARRRGASLALSVEDDGPGPGRSTHRGTQTSQADLEDRLRLAYGGRARFTTGRGALGGFRVDIELPA